MKKLLGIVVLSLFFNVNSYATNLKPLTQYLDEMKGSDDPATLLYLVSRCAAYFNFAATITYKTNKDLSDKFVNMANETNLSAIQILVKSLDHTAEDASAAVLSNVNKISDYYLADGKDNHAKTGSYIKGSYIEGDNKICNEIYTDYLKK